MKKILLIIVCCLYLTGCGNKTENLNIQSIESSLAQINEIASTCIVTDENDTNGKLNKEGGYIGALFFTHSDIENDSNENPCELGTSAGGSIEIYKNNNDAEKRNDYLSNFDGSILSDYHQVDGNIVIRISNYLNDTKQKELYNQIIDKIQSTN